MFDDDLVEFNHLNVSLIKSAMRIIAGIFLCLSAPVAGFSDFVWVAGVFLIVAELLGIAEELV